MNRMRSLRSSGSVGASSGLRAGRPYPGSNHPAVLLEGGFLSNPAESKLIHQTTYQATLARSVAAAVKKCQLAVTRPVAVRGN